MTEEQIDENCHLIGDLIERMISDDYLEMRYTDWMTGSRQFAWTGKQPKSIGSIRLAIGIMKKMPDVVLLTRLLIIL